MIRWITTRARRRRAERDAVDAMYVAAVDYLEARTGTTIIPPDHPVPAWVPFGMQLEHNLGATIIAQSSRGTEGNLGKWPAFAGIIDQGETDQLYFECCESWGSHSPICRAL